MNKYERELTACCPHKNTLGALDPPLSLRLQSTTGSLCSLFSFAGGTFAEGGNELRMCRLPVVRDESPGTKVEAREPYVGDSKVKEAY